MENFPGTRYMGSKAKLLDALWQALDGLEFDSVLDAFAGSSVVSYYFKTKGKQVLSNDFLHFSYQTSKAIIENDSEMLSKEEVEMLINSQNDKSFIQDTFRDLYFVESDNAFLDLVRGNIHLLKGEYKQSIALAALVRACFKKRPRGIFTYTGLRYDDGRRDLQLTLEEQFMNAVDDFNQAVFSNGNQCHSYNSDIFNLESKSADLVYFDPPYLSLKSDNDYLRRYHFVEGLVRNWKGVEIQSETKTKKFKRYPSLFDSKKTILDAFELLFKKYKDSILVLSYSSNSIPQKEILLDMLRTYKDNVHLIEVDYKYSFGNQGHKVDDNFNDVQEYIFVGH